MHCPHLIIIVFGVPAESSVIIHVKIGVASRLSINKVIESDGHPTDPVHAQSISLVLGAQVVVSAVLRVDGVQDSLDPVILGLVNNVGQVSTIVCMYVWVYSSSNDGTGYKVMIVQFFYSGGEGYLQ